MAELSEGLDLSNVSATTRDVQGITSTAMNLTGLESLHTVDEAARPAKDCA